MIALSRLLCWLTLIGLSTADELRKYEYLDFAVILDSRKFNKFVNDENTLQVLQNLIYELCNHPEFKNMNKNRLAIVHLGPRLNILKQYHEDSVRAADGARKELAKVWESEKNAAELSNQEAYNDIAGNRNKLGDNRLDAPDVLLVLTRCYSRIQLACMRQPPVELYDSPALQMVFFGIDAVVSLDSFGESFNCRGEDTSYYVLHHTIDANFINHSTYNGLPTVNIKKITEVLLGPMRASMSICTRGKQDVAECYYDEKSKCVQDISYDIKKSDYPKTFCNPGPISCDNKKCEKECENKMTWSACSVTCGQGTETRQLSVNINADFYRNKHCPKNQRTCQRTPCPTTTTPTLPPTTTPPTTKSTTPPPKPKPPPTIIPRRTSGPTTTTEKPETDEPDFEKRPDKLINDDAYAYKMSMNLAGVIILSVASIVISSVTALLMATCVYEKPK